MGAGQTPVQRIRALHMKTATGAHCPGMPQQTAYILQVILAQFGRLSAWNGTFRTRSTLALRGHHTPYRRRRRRLYYGKTASLVVWYARAAPSPIPAEPMLTIGSDGEYRLWRDGTRLEAVRDHNWHCYYGNGARRNRTRLRPVTYCDGKSDFWRRQHLGIWMVFGPVFLLQRGLPRKKIGKKNYDGGFQTVPESSRRTGRPSSWRCALRRNAGKLYAAATFAGGHYSAWHSPPR